MKKTKSREQSILFFDVETVALTPLVYEEFESRYYQYDSDGLSEFLEEHCDLDLQIYKKYYLGNYSWLICYEDFPYILKINKREVQSEI